MQPYKNSYAAKTYSALVSICNVISDDKQNPVVSVLSISPSEVKLTIQKIIKALPDRFFYSANHAILQDMMNLIIKNYILFQSQEDYYSSRYTGNFLAFIHALSDEIETRYYVQ